MSDIFDRLNDELKREAKTVSGILQEPGNEDLKEWFTQYNKESGFMFCDSGDPMMQRMWNIADPDQHSGFSYAILLRKVQDALLNPDAETENEIRKKDRERDDFKKILTELETHEYKNLSNWIKNIDQEGYKWCTDPMITLVYEIIDPEPYSNREYAVLLRKVQVALKES
jgi:hypothetical protein